MIEEAKELDELIEDRYVPTALERKKALLMYFLIGVIVSLSNLNKSKYEKYHLKQATGWWLIFFLILVFTGFLFFIPIINIIGVLIFLLMIGIWIFFVKQAWWWFYTIGDEKIILPFFSGIWSWVMVIFEVEEEEEEKELQEIEKNIKNNSKQVIEQANKSNSDSTVSLDTLQDWIDQEHKKEINEEKLMIWDSDNDSNQNIEERKS